MKIVLLGAGNVGTQMGLALLNAGHTIVEVFSQTQENAESLANKLKAKANSNFDHINKEADLYILCVNDDVADLMAAHLKLENKIIVHTSGTLPLAILSNSSNSFGTFYPLQSLSKTKSIDFKKEVPLCIEANDDTTLKTVEKLAKSISDNVSVVNSEHRLYLHLAAVIVNNFSNYLYSVAEKILKDQDLSFELLYPLIKETAEKIKNHSPKEMQTGPAIRNDVQTMQKHLALLEKYREIQSLYKQISYSISEPKRLNQN